TSQYAYVSDAVAGAVYVVDIDIHSQTYHQVVYTIQVDAPLGLRGLDQSADGRYLYVAAPGRSLFSRADGSTGTIFVIDTNRQSETFWRVVGEITVGPEPYGVEA